MKFNSKIVLTLLVALALALGGVGSWSLINQEDAAAAANGEQIASVAVVDDATATTTAVQSSGKTYEVSSDPFGVKSLGDPNAPVKIEEFASFTCNHCASFHNVTFPKLKERFIDTGLVHFTFTDFPLNGPALQASMLARCMPGDRYFTFVDLLFKTQDQWAFGQNPTQALRQNAKLAGLSDDAIDACLNNEKLKEHLAQTMQDKAAKYQVSSTPSFVFNDGVEKLIGAQPIERIEETINALK